jgi:hypothetical protein
MTAVAGLVSELLLAFPAVSLPSMLHAHPSNSRMYIYLPPLIILFNMRKTYLLSSFACVVPDLYWLNVRPQHSPKACSSGLSASGYLR